MEDNPRENWKPMESLFRTWLEGARDREVLRLLELVRDELDRRGYTLTYEVKRRRPSGRQEA